MMLVYSDQDKHCVSQLTAPLAGAYFDEESHLCTSRSSRVKDDVLEQSPRKTIAIATLILFLISVYYVYFYTVTQARNIAD